MARPISIPQQEIDEMIDKYVNHRYSMCKLSKIFGYSQSTIKKCLKNNGVHIRDLRESHELFYDKEYFKTIDTPEKAYWLGFIYADGSVSKRNVFSIKLSIKDINHLYKLKSDLKSQHIVGEYEMESEYGHVKYCMFSINSNEICEQLKNLGVKCNKTKICNFPDENILPREYVWDFIRGFFDGDGSVYISTYKWENGIYKCPGVSFVGTEDMLQSILEEVKKHYKTNTTVRPYYDGKPVFDLKFGGIELVNTIYHLIYDNATRCLNRKKSVFEQFLIDDKLQTIKLPKEVA